ncbi:Cell wall surface anchor family protein [Rhodotorula toruloides]|nr:Cell wall surface anchor family protein [Rhodotorula toruloides]
MAKTAQAARDGPLTHARDSPDAPEALSADSHPDSRPFSSPTLPLELVKEILGVCWDDETVEGRAAVFTSCSVSRAFASVARDLIWRTVLVECVNVVKSYEEGHADEMASPYFSSSCWELSPTARCRLDVLLGRPDLRILVRVFEICPPDGVFRSGTARMWTTNFGLLQGVVSTLPAVTTLGIGWIRDPDGLYLQPPSSSDSLQILFAASATLDEHFATAFPNLRRLSLRYFTAYRALEPKRCPPVEYLKVHCGGSDLRRLLRSFHSTLVHLWLDQLPTYDYFHVKNSRYPSKLLQSLVRLQDFSVTLRNIDTTTSERTSRWSAVGGPDHYDYLFDHVSQAFGILATLPRCRQVVVHFALPPLANPEQRCLNKRFWQDFFGRVRDGGTLDAMVPKTVKEVDWSGVFGEDE